jgi:hypothetical protein
LVCDTEFVVDAATKKCVRCDDEGSKQFFDPAKPEKCQDCDESCASCDSADKCKTCPANTGKLTPAKPELCAACAADQFLTNHECTQCHESCATCDDLTKCTKCKEGYEPGPDGLCIQCKAEDNLYYDEETKSCKNCDDFDAADFDLAPVTVTRTKVPFE